MITETKRGATETKQCSRKTEPFCKQHAAQHAAQEEPAQHAAQEEPAQHAESSDLSDFEQEAVAHARYIPDAGGCDFSRHDRQEGLLKFAREPRSYCSICNRRHADSSIFISADETTRQAGWGCLSTFPNVRLWYSASFVSDDELLRASVDKMWARRLRALKDIRFHDKKDLHTLTSVIRDDQSISVGDRMKTWLTVVAEKLGPQYTRDEAEIKFYWLDSNAEHAGKLTLGSVMAMIKQDDPKEFMLLHRAEKRAESSDSELIDQMHHDLAAAVAALDKDLIRADNGVEYNDLTMADRALSVEELALLIRQTVINTDNNGAPSLFVKTYADQKFGREYISTIKYEPRAIQAMRFYTLDIKYQDSVLQDTLDNLLKAVLRHINHRQVVVEPYGALETNTSHERGRFNLFPGFVQRYDPAFVADESIVRVWADHIKHVWANDDEAVYLHIMRLFRHMIINPMEKSGLVLIVKGKQGAGKNSPVDVFYRYVLGPSLTLTTPRMDMITGRFNSIRQSLLGCCLDEAVDNSDRAAMNRFKNLITSDEVQIERKCQDAYTISDFANYIVVSNGDFASFIEESDRRSLCLETSNDRVGDRAYFANFWRTLGNLSAGKHIFHWLINNVEMPADWHPQAAPTTAYKQELKQSQASTPVKFLLSWREQAIDSGDATEHKIANNDLWGMYIAFCEETRNRAVSQNAFFKITKPFGQASKSGGVRAKILSVEILSDTMAAFL